MSVSLYRKYRPQTFDAVVGQEHIERTLRNAVADGNVSHAYLFTGPRGTGKTTTARLLAKALLCENGPTPSPCGVCQECRDIAAGNHPDVIELDAASRTGVDNVREEIISRVVFAPTRGNYKVYIIDEVHMLSVAAFNALLKTLEEPPSHVVFIMCTTDPHKVPDTVLSRCQRFDFHRIPVEAIAANLRAICDSEGYTADPRALELVAQHSSGGMRDAISTLEKLAVFCNGSIGFDAAQNILGEVASQRMLEISAAIAQRDTAACFAHVARMAQEGTDFSIFSKELTKHVRNLYVAGLTGGRAGLEGFTPQEISAYAQQAGIFGRERLSRMLIVLGDLCTELRNSTDPRLSLEIAFTRMTQPHCDLTLESLAERIANLERGGVPNIAINGGLSEKGSSLEDRSAKTPSPAPAIITSAPAPAPMAAQPSSIREQSGGVNDILENPLPSAPTKPAPTALQLDPGRAWDEIVGRIRTQRRSLGALLGNTQLAAVDANHYQVRFPADASNNKSMVERGDNRLLIEKIGQEILGATARFSFALAAASTVNSGLSGKVSPLEDRSAETPSPAPAVVAVAPTPAQPSAPTKPQPAAQASQREVDDLASLLSAGFGMDIMVTEVDD